MVNLKEPYFSLIKLGKKTAEGRVLKDKFKEFHVGDYVKIGDPENEDRYFFCIITYLHLCESFEKLIKFEGIDIMLPSIAQNIEDGVKIYRSFPRYSELEKQLGVVAIGLKVVS